MLFAYLNELIMVLVIVIVMVIAWRNFTAVQRRHDLLIDQVRRGVARVTPIEDVATAMNIRRDVLPGPNGIYPYPAGQLRICRDIRIDDLRDWVGKNPDILNNFTPRSVRYRAGLPFRVGTDNEVKHFSEREAVISAVFDSRLPSGYSCDRMVASFIYSAYLHELDLVYVKDILGDEQTDLTPLKLIAPSNLNGVPTYPLEYLCSYWISDMETIGACYMNILEKYGSPCSLDEFLIQVKTGKFELSNSYSDLDITTFLATWSVCTSTAVPLAYLPNDIYRVMEVVSAVDDYRNNIVLPHSETNQVGEKEECAVV